MGNPLKKTMVYLGLADEEQEYEEPQAQHPRAVRQEAEAKPAPVTPLRRPAVVRQPAAGPLSEIATSSPGL